MDVIEFKTPSGHVVYLKPYLTYGQKKELKKTLLKNIRVNPKTREMSDFGSDVLLDAQDLALKMLIEKIVEADGKEYSGNDVLSAVNNWKEEDGDALMDKIDDLTTLQEETNKKKSK